MAAKKQKQATKRVIVYVSLLATDAARLDAFGEKEVAKTGAPPKRGTFAAQLIRLGLAAAEAS